MASIPADAIRMAGSRTLRFVGADHGSASRSSS
ncbi:hypothetical protein SAMN04489720_2071 [Agrococcus jejuensis]|uniref:Uncharacterized protein n=1 Tax=Agrococcus jejuensis TaxID=399736 RepID=A0A1G8EJR9_9MICO|nr:hypothetical protein SAMN04489720_2071 [Agrococcus jejuensis]